MGANRMQVVAVILAGGLGTRIRHLLPGLPKPMAPVAGRPFVEWIARYLARQGIERVVLSTGYLAESIADHFRAHTIPGLKVHCVTEPAPLGTGGGFLHAAQASGESAEFWLVLNGDSLVYASLAGPLALVEDSTISGVLVARRVPDTGRYGTVRIGPENELLGFEEKGQSGPGYINTGIYLFRDALLNQFPSQRPLSLEKDVFPALIARRARFLAQNTNAPFLDIGTPESLVQAEDFIARNQDQFLLTSIR